MAKNRITIYLNEIQSAGLKKMMSDDMGSDNTSAFMVRLLSEEAKRREESKNKRGRGRPQKDEEAPDELYEPDYSDDLPKTINYYGRLIGKQEMEDIEEKTRMHNAQHREHEG